MKKVEQILLKSVRLRVFNVENHGHTTRVLRAGAGNGYPEGTVDRILEEVTDDLDRRFPDDDFEMVQVAHDAWNFVWRGKRCKQK